MRNALGSEAALAAFVLAAVGLFLFAGVMFGGDTFGSAEHVFRTLPALDALGDGLRSGQLIEWWDGLGLGVPLAANPDHAALYPLTWLAAALGARGVDIAIAVHAMAAGAGAAVLSRRLGAGALGSATAAGGLLGATLLSSSAGWFAPAVFAVAWTPWIGWAGHRVGTEGPSVSRCLALCALVGAQLSTGQFCIAAASGGAALALSASRGKARSALWSAAAVAGGALLAMHVILAAVYVDLNGAAALTAPLAGRDVASVLWPGSWYIGLPTACVVAASAVGALASSTSRWDVAVAAFAGVGLVVAGLWLGGRWPLVGLAVMVPAAGAGIETLVRRGASRVQLGAMLIVAFVAVIAARASGVAAIDVASAGIAAAVVTGCAAACARVKLRVWAGPLLCAVVVGHAVSHARSAPRVDRDRVLARPAALGELGNQKLRDRIARPRLPGDATGPLSSDQIIAETQTLAPNAPTRFSIAAVPGAGRAVSARLREVWQAAAPHAERFLDLYAIGYVVVPASVTTPANMPVAGTTPDGKLAVAVNLEHRPRAFVAPKWRWYQDEAELQNTLFPPAREGARPLGMSTIRLLGSGPVSSASGPKRAHPCELEIAGDEAVLECETKQAGFAVLLDTYAAGWSAKVDGKAAAIERADLLARAVWIEPGTHRIAMTYRAPGLRLGAVVAALAWLNLLVGWLIAVRKQSRADAAG